MVTVEWCTQRLVNLYTAWREMLVDILYRLGLDSVAALRGRTDLLTHLDYERQRSEQRAMTQRDATDCSRAEAILRSRADLRPRGRLVPPAAGGRGRLRRDRLRLHDPRRRQAHLRALDPDAQPRQRQGRRHRRLRPGAGRHGRLAQGARRGLHPPGGPARSDGPRRGGEGVHRAVFRRRPGRADPHGGRLPRGAAAGSPPAGRGPLLRPRQARRCWPASPRRRGLRPGCPSGTSKTSSSSRTRSG